MKIEILDDSGIALLRDELKIVRGGGVTLAVARHPQLRINQDGAISIIKDFVQHLFGLTVAFEKLPQLRSDEALQEASSWLQHDFAHGFELMSQDAAAAYVRRIFDWFANPSFFSTRFGDNSWHPITKSMFDAGLLIIDQAKAGLLVIQDDD
jgi:hypothetical protein